MYVVFVQTCVRVANQTEMRVCQRGEVLGPSSLVVVRCGLRSSCYLCNMSIVVSLGTAVSSQCRTRAMSRAQPKGTYVLNCYVYTLVRLLLVGRSVCNLTCNNLLTFRYVV